MDDRPLLSGGAADAAYVLSPRERAMVAAAEASVARHGTIPADEVHAWVASLLTPNPLPMPLPRTGAAKG
jgi:alkylhydroperoxidase family enzyme